MMKKDRISIDGDSSALSDSPFAELDPGNFTTALPTASSKPVPVKPAKPKTPDLGRVEVRRETSGRAGKAVTTIRAFRAGSSKAARSDLLRELKKKLAVGGFLRPDGGLEIQGDHRESVTTMLSEKGYRPVQAGG
jgi:predicted translation initiation factor SUI1